MEKTTSTERHIQSNLQNKTGNAWKRDNSGVSGSCLLLYRNVHADPAAEHSGLSHSRRCAGLLRVSVIWQAVRINTQTEWNFVEEGLRGQNDHFWERNAGVIGKGFKTQRKRKTKEPWIITSAVGTIYVHFFIFIFIFPFCYSFCYWSTINMLQFLVFLIVGFPPLFCRITLKEDNEGFEFAVPQNWSMKWIDGSLGRLGKLLKS